jgi:hypothetical protein
MALVDAVMKRFPDVDRLMAETIVMAHENGTLKQHLPMLEETEKAEQKSSGSISIEQWSEDKSAVLSTSTAA